VPRNEVVRLLVVPLLAGLCTVASLARAQTPV